MRPFGGTLARRTFPRPNSQKPAQPPPSTAKPVPPPAPAPQAPAPQAPQAPKAAQAPNAGPSEAELGAPIYPSAVYLTSYDAGRAQRFYIYGGTVP
jgi:hypothetical protein